MPKLRLQSCEGFSLGECDFVVMNLLHENIKRDLARLLQEGLEKIGAQESLENLYGLIGPTPNIEMGHLAFPLFTFAKSLRKGPPMLAADLAAAMPQRDWIQSASPAGPYLNFVLRPEKWAQEVLVPILDGSMFTRQLSQDTPRTMIEYSQPNTHKEMHVGHMRNLALGDALIRMHRYAGYDIVSATFPGDVGTHVAKCLWYLQSVNTEPAPASNLGAWLGLMYVKANNLLAEIKGTEAEVAAKAIMTEILQQLENHAGPYFELWKETRQWSIELMESAYRWADVTFDAWYWESDVDADSMAYVRQKYAEGAFVESNGAIGMDLTDVDPELGFAMLIKSDGTGLYATKDIELARRKFEENGIERSVYIVDQRQTRHFRQVFEVLKRLGFAQADQCFHMKYDYVEGKDGMFSSRAGNAVPLFDLIHQMEHVVYTKHLAGQVNSGNMDKAEAEAIATTVAKGAIKFGMIRIDPNKVITFDMDEWTEISGESGPYLQYAYARIQSLLKKQGFDPQAEMDFSKLENPREFELLLKASQFNDIVLAAAQSYRPNMLTNYLYELAKLYNSWNNAVIIRDIEDAVAKNTKLAMTKMVADLIQKGLEIMGIPVPERM
jgi:arginyl-tRNA synthetase